MSFERALGITPLWNWLPAFRAAAEYESIQKAGLVLGVSASAVSRTVKQLEEAIGETLFERHATGLTLTPRGETLLRATRDAMRVVDDALAPRVELTRIGTVGPFMAELVACALADHPCPVHLSALGALDVVSALCRGDADVVLTHSQVTDDALVCEPLGDLGLVVAAVQPQPEALVSWHGLFEVNVRLTHTAADVPSITALATSLRAGAVLPRRAVHAPLRVLDRPETRLPVFVVQRRPLGASSASPAPAWLARLEALVSQS